MANVPAAGQAPATADDNAHATASARLPSPTPTEAARPAHPPQTRQRRQRTRATCPDAGSLYDILRENCGRSLFVLPILWTDIHTRLLRTEFVAHEPILDAIHRTPLASSGSTEGTRSQVSPRSSADETLSFDLTALLSAQDMRPFSKPRAMKNVLSSLFPTPFSRPKSNSDLDVHFGERVFRKAVRIPVLWSSPGGAESSFDSAVTRVASSFGPASNSVSFTQAQTQHTDSQGPQLDGPTVAYVNRSHLAMIRQNLFRIVPGPEGGDVANTPVSRLQSLRSKQLMPTERDRDPYLMGVFLGMAQAHFYEAAPARGPSQGMWWNSAQRNGRSMPVAPFRDVKLRIVTHDDETSDFMVYTTTVTAALLTKFAEPTKNTAMAEVEAAGGMTIGYTRVPVWPILGLRARLGKALGSDIVGDVERENEGGDEAGSGDKTEPETETDKSAVEKTSQVSDNRGTRVDSLKRKRSERKSFTGVLGGSDSGSNKSSGKGKGKEPAANTSPASPRKRRQTRSLSSSLAVC